MPEVECSGVTAGKLTPRACYSACVSGVCTPVDYACSPAGVRTPGREPQPVKSTLSYMDLAAPTRAAESTALPGGADLPGSPGGSVSALVARTWAHDMSADARRNRTARTDAAVTSGNAPSGLPAANCTPAKVAIVVKLELMSDQPLTLRPVSTAHGVKVPSHLRL